MASSVRSLDISTFTLCTMGHSGFQYVFAGFELGLFRLLYQNPGLTSLKIAAELNLEERPCRCLLFGLTGLHFLDKIHDRYYLATLIRELAQNEKLELLTKFMRFQALIVYPGQVDFVASLRSNHNEGLRRIEGTGGDLYKKLAGNPLLRSIFFEFMSAWSLETVPFMLRAFDFSGHKKLMDVGGGDGTVAALVAQAYPHLHIRLMDIPGICSLTCERLASHEVGERIEVVESDVLQETFADGYDCILFAHFLMIWSPKEIHQLLHKAYAALPRGGKVLIFSSMAEDEETGPLFAALDTSYFLTIPAQGGFVYPWKNYEEWLSEVGFQSIQRIDCSTWWTSHGLIVGIK